jgi:Flp pilus assembly protein TadD
VAYIFGLAKVKPVLKKKAAPTVKPTPQAPVNVPSATQAQTVWAWMLFAFGALLYINTLGHGFVLDDVAVIEKNKFVQQGLAGIPKLLTTFYWQGFWDLNSGLYRPLSMVMFAIEEALFPGSAALHHLVNVLLFAACVLVLFKLLLRLFGNQNALLAIAATVLYAAHPIHTEVVANIKSRDELLAMFTMLLSGLYLLKYLSSNKPLHLAVSVGAYALALFSKESGITFIVIYALLIYYKGGVNVKRAAVVLLPYAISAAVFLVIHWLVIKSGPAHVAYTYRDNSLFAISSTADRIATAMFMLGKYLVLLVFPHPLSYDYSFNQIPATKFTDWRVWLSVLAYGALIVYGIRGVLRKSVIGFSIAVFGITIAVTSNLVFLIGATMAERFLFIPSLGFCIALAWLLVKYIDKSKTQTLQRPMAMFSSHVNVWAVVLVIAAFYSFKTITRNADWKNADTLYTADVNTAPNSYNVQYNYGTLLLLHNYEQTADSTRKEQILNQCVQVLQHAISIDSLGAAAYVNLSSALYKLHRNDEAFIAIDKALWIDSGDVSLYETAGTMAYRAHRLNNALSYLYKAMAHGRLNENVYRFMGITYFDRQQYDSSAYYYTNALQLNPNNIETVLNLGNTYGINKNYAMAAVYFKKALALNPGNPNIQNSLLRAFNDGGHADSVAIYMHQFSGK